MHAYGFFFHAFQGQNIFLIELGHLGVDLFFVLSGFIISYVHAKDFSELKLSAIYKFLSLRIARIYPIHFLTLICLAGVVFFSPGFVSSYQDAAFSSVNLLANFLLIHTWITPLLPLDMRGPGWSWNGPSWSLSAELLMYLLFPFIAKGLSFIKSKMTLFVLGAVSLAFYGLCISQSIELAGLPRAFFEFIAGCCIYHATSETTKNTKLWNYTCFAAIFFTLLLIQGVSFKYIIPFTFFLFIPAIAYGDNLITRIFSNQFMVWLGNISLSLYLIHWPLIQLQQYYLDYDWSSSFSGIVYYLLFLTGIIFLSHVIYLYFEVPSRSIVRKLLLPNKST